MGVQGFGLLVGLRWFWVICGLVVFGLRVFGVVWGFGRAGFSVVEVEGWGI